MSPQPAIAARTLCALIFAGAFLPFARSASAQQAGACDQSPDARGDEVVVRPADGAEHVARDAPVIARYAAGSDLAALQAALLQDSDPACRGRVICVFELHGQGASAERSAVAGDLQALGDGAFAFVPSRPFAAGAAFSALVARPGFDTASRTSIDFHTGTAFDRDPPELASGAGGLELDVEAPPAECGAPEGSLRVRVAVPGVHDDGDEESVELLLFVTRAAGLRAPELRARASNRPEASADLTFTLDPAEAAGTVCVAVRAIDGSGKASEGEPELCFEPRAGSRSAFAGLCAARRAHAGADKGRGLLLASAFVVAALVERSRRRRTSTRPLES